MSSKKPDNELGKTIKKQRIKLGLGIRELSRIAKIDDSTIVKYENGERSTNPNPKILEKLAKALQIPVADLYASAGYTHSKELPSPAIYFRTKYKHLPDEAHKELDKYIKDLHKRYPDAGKGPEPGEDE
jgi:transcriptional regulator with XRE-family HTH domain